MDDEELLTLPPVTSWSYSSLKQFEKCPHSIYLQKVTKEPAPPREPDSPLERGTRIHLLAEQYVRGELDEVPHELRKVETDLVTLREDFSAGLVRLEEDWAFDLTWAAVEWTAPDAWARMKLDVQYWHDESNLTIFDWKTGKRFGNEVPHTTQGQVYVIGAFRRFPELETAAVQMIYTDEGKRSPVKYYDRAIAAQYEVKLTERALQLTTATYFPPKPSKYACQYCDYGRNKGTGACGYAAA